jgi:hypothetical protein
VNIIGISGFAGSGKDTVANFLLENDGFIKLSLADPIKRFAMDTWEFSEEQLFGDSKYRNIPDKRYYIGSENDNTLSFNGVIWDDNKNKWCSFIDNDNKKTIIGYFDTEGEAALAYDQRAVELFGDSVKTNTSMYLTPRLALQNIGTEGTKFIDSNVWIRYAVRTATKLLEAGPKELCYSQVHGLQSYRKRSKSFPEKVKTVIIPDVRFRDEINYIKKIGGKLIRVIKPDAGLSGDFAFHQSEIEMVSIPDSEFDIVINNIGTLLDLEYLVNDSFKIYQE